MNRWRRLGWRLLPLLLLLVAGVPAPGAEGDSLRCRQPDGSEVTVPLRPRRVVIGYGSLVPVWYCAGGRAVGIPSLVSAENLPAAARELPEVGSFNVLNAERILALKPDLVLLMGKVASHRRLREFLVRSGIPVLLVKYDNYQDFRALLELFCRVNGTRIEERPEAVALLREIEAVTERCRKRGPGPGFVTLFVAGGGIRVESDRANSSGMIAELGGRNLARDRVPEEALRAAFGLEPLLLLDPEVIFIVTMGDSEALREKFRREVMSQEAWRRLRAARAGRVHFLPSELFLYVPGMRFPKAFGYLERLLYPEEVAP